MTMDAETSIEPGLPGRPRAHLAGRGTSVAGPRPAGAALRQGVADPLARFDRAAIFKKTPCIPDLKPGGRDLAKDMHDVGVIPLLMTTLLDHDPLHGDCPATGRSIPESLKSVKGNSQQDAVRAAGRPSKRTFGSEEFAPEGAIVKVVGMSDVSSAGPARGIDRAADAFGAVFGRFQGRFPGRFQPDTILNVKLTDLGVARRPSEWTPRETNPNIGCGSGLRGIFGKDGAAARSGGAHEKQRDADI